MERLKEKIKINTEKVTLDIEDFIRDKIDAFKRNGAILGISGGIDSACIAGLLSRAINKNKILGLIMPERDSDKNTVRDAELVAHRFGIKTRIIDITKILESFGIYETLPGKFYADKRKSIGKFIKKAYRLIPNRSNPFIGGLLGTRYEWMREVQAYYRIKDRIRMVHLYYYGEKMNYLIIGTSNKTEDLIGFFVKYGDSAADIMPIANLYKIQVRRLSEYLGVPELITKKESSPDLLPGITDEVALGLSYEKLDLILLGLKSNIPDALIQKEIGCTKDAIEYVKRIVSLSSHMRNLPEKWTNG
ncbi:MAG: NAD(+) synthase [candidate division WOR-3 bacterium]|nr:NAD(+) synthase [candidate division WOR-3 bacterium]